MYKYEYDWDIWWKAEPEYQQAMRPKTINLTAQSMFEKVGERSMT